MIKREEPQCASRSRNSRPPAAMEVAFSIAASLPPSSLPLRAVNGDCARIADGGHRRRGGVVVVSAAYTVAQ